MKGIESKRRGRSVEDNLRAWEEMKKGSEEGLTTAMRFKIDIKVGALEWLVPYGLVMHGSANSLCVRVGSSQSILNSCAWKCV